MRLVNRLLALGIAAGALLAAASASASAATIDVLPGDSIQAAVNKTHPGDVIVVHRGVYRESIQIKKDHLALRGAGDSRNGSVIKPEAHTNRCEGGSTGICVLAPGGGQGGAIAGTRISGFRVQGFRGSGGLTEGARNTVFRNDTFVRNEEYGVAAFSSQRTKFLHNVAKDAGEAGFYVGDSPHANAVLRGNRARHNHEFGFFLRDASHALLVHNRAVGNCLGVGLINTGAPGGVHDWTVKRNRVLRNNRRCPGGEEGPPISGTGIGLLGARGNLVRKNVVLGNNPSGGSAFPGGIVLASSTPLGGSNAAHNRISRNRAFRNQPDDIAWDGKGQGNRFAHNRCGSSEPSGICQ